MNNNRQRSIYSIPYTAWILLFVLAPIALIVYYSFFDLTGNFTLSNYANFFSSVYLKLTISSFWYAFPNNILFIAVRLPNRLCHNEDKA